MKSTITKGLLVLSTLLATIFVGEACVRLRNSTSCDDKKLGWRVTENFHSDRVLKDAGGKEYRAKVTTDNHGFRLFGDPWSEKEKVLVIGDSFTEASDVSDDKTYFSLLAIKNLRIWNFSHLEDQVIAHCRNS